MAPAMIYQLTLTGLILGSTATVTEAGTTNILGQVTNHGAPTWAFSYSDGGFAVDIRVVALGMAPWSARVTLPAANSSIPVDQAVDRSLLIPVSARAAARAALEVLSESEVQALIDAVDTGGGAWGSITGTLSNQADLQSVLAAKASTTDPRFTDARPPTSHKSSHATGGSDALTPADIGAEASSNKGLPNGYASLDGGGKVPAAQIPAIAITEYLGTVANEAGMLALSGQAGDWCIRTDTSTVWVIVGADPALLSSWVALAYPLSLVLSVAGRTGAIVLTAADIGSGVFDAARLPLPTTTSIGGVKRNTGSAGQYVTGVSATGDLQFDTPAGGGGGSATSITESSGPTALAVGAISAGQPLVRVGTGVQGMSGVTWDDATKSRTLVGATITASAPVDNLSQTWNNAAVTFTGWYFNVTDTASASASLLWSLAVGGSVRASVRKDGRFDCAGNASFVNGAWLFQSTALSASRFSLLISGITRGMYFGDGMEVGWQDSSSPGTSRDLALLRDAANVLAQRNGTNAQASRVYNTWTNASNGEWLNIGWASNRCTIEPQANGTGTVRPLIVRHPPVTLATLPSAATAGAGARSVISDSSVAMTGNFGAVAAGGGANTVPIISDGTDWRIG